jgi:hypothetical protein
LGCDASNKEVLWLVKLRRKKKDYSPDDVQEQTFTAFIIKGNRQVVRREVIASKRFRVDDETYLIKPDCIFLKNIDGAIHSISVYREGNPNPYNFQEDNIGIKAKELDRVFAEDFFHIITALQPENRLKYVLLIVAVNVALSFSFAVGVILRAYGII